MQAKLIQAPTVRHPAKYTDALIPVFAEMLTGCKRILDPFAGTGKIHQLGPILGAETVGIEIEPEWANMHPKTQIGNALDLPFVDESFDAICVSPTYANRMADSFESKDGSKRNTYRHAIGRPLHADNSGQMQWGGDYRTFHFKAWKESLRVLKPGGKFVLNCKNHIRGGEVMRVTEWHLTMLTLQFDLEVVEERKVKCPGNGFGANGKLRVPYETVALLRKP